MKVLIFADPHITKDSAFSKPTKDGLTTYLHQVIKSFDWISDKIIDLSPDLVVCLGDITDTTGFIDTQSLNVTYDVSELLMHSADMVGAKVIYLVGNHDFYSISHNIHNIKFLKNLGVQVIDRPTIIEDSVNFMCIPWADNYKEVSIPSNVSFVLSHLDIKGSRLVHGNRLKDGLDPKSFNVPVFNGHLHMPSINGSVVNVGSILSRDFNDVNSGSRGMIIYDTISGAYNRIDNPHDIPFKDIKILNGDDADTYSNPDLISNLSINKSYIRVHYSEEYSDVAKSLSSLSLGCKTSAVSIDNNIDNTIRSDDTKYTSIEQYFKKYLYDNSSMQDKETLLKLGIAYISKVGDTQSLTIPPNLKLERIEATNFQLFESLDLDLSKPGLYCVEGVNLEDDSESNESGKSTIHECIYWALTGKSLRKGYSGNDVIKWGEKSCRVELTLLVSDVRYKIIRSRKDKQYGTGANLLIQDGDEFVSLTPRRSQDASKEIDAMIRRSPAMLKHSVFLTSGLTEKFTSLSYPARVKLIEEVANLEKLSMVEYRVKEDLSSISRDVIKESSSLDRLKSVLTNSNDRIEELNKEIASEQGRLVSSDLGSINESIKGLKEALESSNKSIVDLKSAIETIDSTIDEENNVLITVNDAILRISNDISSERSTLKHHNNVIVSFKRLLKEGKCGNCGQKVDKDSKTYDLLKESVNLSKNSSEKINKLQGKLDRVESKSKIISDSVSKLTAKRKSLNNRYSEFMDRIRNIESDILEMKSKKDIITSKLQSLFSRKDELNKSIDETKIAIDKSEKILNDLINEEKLMSRLLAIFSTNGIRSHILFTTILPYMNKRLLNYSTIMGKPCSLSYKLNKAGELEDKIDVLQSGKYKDKVPYSSNSSGGARKIDLAIQCAFRDLSLNSGGSGINFLVCDEIDHPLDSLGLNRFLEILKEQSEDKTIFITAHRPFFSNLFDKRISVSRKNGCSKVSMVV